MRILACATTALRQIVDLGLVVLIFVVLFGVILAKGAPLTGHQSIAVGGGSMEPSIGLGAAIVIHPVAPADLAVGDVVSLQVGPEQTTYTHRIVAVVDRPDGRWIRTKGDANATSDATLVPATEVIGRVELVIPFAGYLLALLSLPIGVLFVLGLAATLLAIAWLLESLEVEPRPAGRRGVADTGLAAGSPEPSLGAQILGVASTALTGLDPELLRGEPIAARRGVLALAGVAALAGPSIAAAAAARPTVREQLARSREARNRRARWRVGRERGRPAPD